MNQFLKSKTKFI